MSNNETFDFGLAILKNGKIPNDYNHATIDNEFEEALKNFELATDKLISINRNIPNKAIDKTIATHSNVTNVTNNDDDLIPPLEDNVNNTPSPKTNKNLIKSPSLENGSVKDLESTEPVTKEAIIENTDTQNSSDNTDINKTMIETQVTQIDNNQPVPINSDVSPNQNEKVEGSTPLSSNDQIEETAVSNTDKTQIVTDNALDDNKRKAVDAISADISKKQRVDQQDTTQPSASNLASAFSTKSITAPAPTFNAGAFTSSSGSLASDSFPLAVPKVKNTEPTNIIEQSSVAKTVAASPFSQSSVIAPAPTFNSNAFANSTASPASTTSFPPTNPNSNISTPTLPTKPFTLPSINFFGLGLATFCSTDMLFEDAAKVKSFIETFESRLKDGGIDINVHWYSLLKTCFEKKKSEYPAIYSGFHSRLEEGLYTWFGLYLYKSFSWTEARSTILSTFGFQSTRIKALIPTAVDIVQQPHEDIEAYLVRYSRVANAAIELGCYSESDLIHKFVAGLTHSSDNILRSLMNVWFTGGVKKWETFEASVRKDMPVILTREKQLKREVKEENERKEQQAILERIQSAKKGGKKAKGKTKKQNKLDKANILDTNALIAERKEQGLCTFCGIERHSYKHSKVCEAKKKLYQKWGK